MPIRPHPLSDVFVDENQGFGAAKDHARFATTPILSLSTAAEPD